ncbi:hypothetical protein ACJROX_16265 [Pseudalkalibacillus sp. A8]|uniref:hypothetical protein n=1 Tax=Pseudalkalibacillus sp. A8 TaxID=3382641 RepID=UPI0038B66510
MARILGLGWDVGGWMGSKQGIAACQFDTLSNEFKWVGQPQNEKIIDHNDWMPGKILQLLDPEASLDDFVVIVIAMDASLGFPIEYKKLVNNESTSIEKPSKDIFNPYAYRETERHIYKMFSKKPLSAPFDKLGNNATLAISYANHWTQNQNFNIHPQQGHKADSRVIIEVYPALIKSYELLHLQQKILALIPEVVQKNTDAYDAAICAILALLYAGNGEIIENITLSDPCINLEIAKEEGWIYYPMKRDVD